MMHYDYWDYPYEMATNLKKLDTDVVDNTPQKPHGELVIKLHAIANSLRRLAMQLEEGVYKDAIPK